MGADRESLAATIGLRPETSAGVMRAAATARPRAAWLAVDRILGLAAPLDALDPESSAVGLGWTPSIAVVGSISVLLSALAANASRAGYDFSIPLVYAACALLFIPATARVVHPHASRAERLTVVIIVTLALFAIRLAREPVAFIDHDEFLHWLTTIDILERGRLFTPNPLLPVSPLFPGLEIVTSAIANVSQNSLFVSAVALLFVGRIVFVAALFFAYEKISGSARVAATGCLVYMGCSTFLVFDAHYSYESLAVVFVALAWFTEALAERSPGKLGGFRFR